MKLVGLFDVIGFGNSVLWVVSKECVCCGGNFNVNWYERIDW